MINNKKNFFLEAVLELVPESEFILAGNTYSGLDWKDERPQPTEEEINAKIAELQAAEPLRVLRQERDIRLSKTDWEVQRNTEMGIDNTDLIAYRITLRNLPQEIEAGNIDAPTLDESGNLVFSSWPER